MAYLKVLPPKGKTTRLFLYRYVPSLSVIVLIGGSVLFLSALLGDRFLSVEATGEKEYLPPERLRALIDDLRGDDHRLVRWDVTRYTRRRQHEGGCDDLSSALDVVASCGATCTDDHKGLACQFATFCVTDNPQQRAVLSQHDGIHEALVNLVKQSDHPHASAMAGHLVYISSFSNAKNQQSFIETGAVEALGGVVKSDDSTRLQIMWAAAALQNLAASYCDTENDGRCYWKWPRKGDRQVISKESLPMISDGSAARQEILQDELLMEKLGQYACQGPVKGRPGPRNVFPGENAVADRDDDSPNIVAWAATGTLKNVALQGVIQTRDYIDPFMPCICGMSRSQDWLEQNKGSGVIRHVRRSDPCWMDENEKTVLCVDRYFLDDEGYDCNDYENADEEECAATNREGNSARTACCPCGGGDRPENEAEDEELRY